MRKNLTQIIVAASLLLGAPPVGAEPIDDMVLVELITATVGQYRNAIKDLEILTRSIRQTSPGVEPMVDSRVQHFLEASVHPPEREMRRLFQRYEQDYGLRAFRRLAQRKGFSDLISR